MTATTPRGTGAERGGERPRSLDVRRVMVGVVPFTDDLVLEFATGTRRLALHCARAAVSAVHDRGTRGALRLPALARLSGSG